MSGAEPINSKADRDRLHHRVGRSRARLDVVRRVLKEYRQGRAASACMADIERLMGEQDTAKRRRAE